MNKTLFYTGLGLLVGAILIPILLFAGDGGSWAGAIVAIMFGYLISPIMGLIGLILMIVGAVAGSNHQQQQVVVVQGGAKHTGFCRSCGAGKVGKFCGQCGAT